MNLAIRWLAYILIAFGAIFFAGTYVMAYLRGGISAIAERWFHDFSDLFLLLICLGPGFALLQWVNNRPVASAPPAPARQAFQLSPTMPDITKGQPVRAFQAQNCMIFLSRNIPSLAGHMTYPLVMAAVDRTTRRPLCFITLECSEAGCFFCGFNRDGSHHNFGLVRISESEFVDRALSTIKAHCRLGDIQEIQRRQ